MPSSLKRFRIEALHGIWTIDAAIEDNKLVLVGENGTGKSTFANFVYFFLTRQWNRMLEHEFKSVLAVIDSEEILIPREDLITHRRAYGVLRRLPPSLRRRVEAVFPDFANALILEDVSELRAVADSLEIPFGLLMDLRMRMTQGESGELSIESERLQKIDQTLALDPLGQVLYLPTYRRIEQELRFIFPDLDDESQKTRDRLIHGRRSGDRGYVELVEFGMEDVEHALQQKTKDIKDNVHEGLNTLTGTYLRDVIQGAYKSADLYSQLKELDEQTLDSIFKRIPEAILSEHEHRRLREIINTIQQIGHIEQEDRVVAHFVTQLLELHRAQQDDERDVREFVRVCSSYLSGKKIVYDNVAFEMYVSQESPIGEQCRLRMKALSSGEKQIVSLFAQMYLSGRANYFVIIDEPELSLSVPWQQRFLPDILRTDRCNGLVAVTHSPFIYENELDQHAHSIEEFMEFRRELR